MKALCFLLIALTIISFFASLTGGQYQPTDAQGMMTGLKMLGCGIASGSFAIAAAIVSRGIPTKPEGDAP